MLGLGTSLEEQREGYYEPSTMALDDLCTSCEGED